MPGAGLRTLPTGFPELDQALPGGGWPLGAIVELLIATPGIGEFRLLLPALRRLVANGNQLLLLDPPHRLNAAALLQAGLDPRGLLLLCPGGGRDAPWAAEQALRNPACGAVLFWSSAARGIGERDLRRLQLAAAEGRSILFLYRSNARQSGRSAALRLELLPAVGGIELSVLKALGTHRRPRLRVAL